ncbi:MAG TPA: alkaline phosphatase family protein [Candidatus Polarisedimenticolia bacterium]|nr:alkaline phosphatase family protein [Candidatus Polarisedimenticolia bacterium]
MSRRWILPVVILVLLFAASLISVEPGTVGVLRGAAGGKSFLLESGLHFRIPFLQRLMAYPAGPFPLDFTLNLPAREGAPVPVQVHFEGLLIRDSLLEFSSRASGRNGPTVVREDLESLIGPWIARHTADEIPVQPLDLADEFRDRARKLGFQIKVLTVMRAPAGGAQPAARTPAPPAPGPRVRVALIGLDGADWQLISPLMERGKLPHLASLKKEGAWAEMRSMDPMLSPLLWTSAATGKLPEEHGVVDFMMRDPESGKRVPVGAASRRVQALWGILSGSGLSCDVVAWWATWPAETINGTMISDRVAYSLFSADGAPPPAGAVSPPEYSSRAARLKVGAESISAQDLAPFLEISARQLADLRKRAAADAALRARDPVLHLTRILAASRTYQAIALDLLDSRQPDFFAIYYQGIDEVSHRFAHFADPKMAMVSEADYRRFRGVVDAYYEYQDHQLGELLSRLDPSSLVLVLSDHGFKNGDARPRDHPPDIEGQPARWHRREGIFLAKGPMVAPGEKKAFSLLEVAPLVLSAEGLPTAQDMPGVVREDLYASEFALSRPRQPVSTYETRISPKAASPVAAADPASAQAQEAMEENLRSLGYIGSGKGGQEPTDTAFAHANLAGIYLQRGRTAEAEKEAKEALRIVPGYLPALVYLAEAYQRQGRFEEAIPPARQAISTDSPDRQPGIYLLLANLYVSAGKAGEGLSDLSTFLAQRGNESDLHSAFGILKAAGGDPAGAEAAFRQALRLDPAAQEPVKRLFDLYRKQGSPERLVSWMESLRKQNPDSAFHASYYALALDQAGRPKEAESAYRRALEKDPAHVGSLVNLGNLLARTRRFQEAIPLFRKAIDEDPRSTEGRVGLGAALSLAGKNDESVAVLEEGEKLGLSSPALYNALAMAYYQQRRKREAIVSLKRSLQLDPAQSSARSLLDEWQRP